MTKDQHENTINKCQGSTVQPEPRQPTIANPGYSNTAEAENELKSNLTKMIETFKEEINKSLKEIQENTNQQVKDINKFVQDLKNGNRNNKNTQLKEFRAWKL